MWYAIEFRSLMDDTYRRYGLRFAMDVSPERFQRWVAWARTATQQLGRLSVSSSFTITDPFSESGRCTWQVEQTHVLLIVQYETNRHQAREVIIKVRKELPIQPYVWLAARASFPSALSRLWSLFIEDQLLPSNSFWSTPQAFLQYNQMTVRGAFSHGLQMI